MVDDVCLRIKQTLAGKNFFIGSNFRRGYRFSSIVFKFIPDNNLEY